MARIRIGTAGWSIASRYADRFSRAGTALERYARRLDAVEINSSFYRPHRPATYERWAASVPDDFRFSVKLPKTITHERRLADIEAPLDRFRDEASQLGGKLGPVLIQLPPSLGFDEGVAECFFAAFRKRFAGAAACEPRHPGWFVREATAMLAAHRIARIAADPAPVAAAARPGAHPSPIYHRLHGSPRIYHSKYDAGTLLALADQYASKRGGEVWIIFDNTAAGEALDDALRLSDVIGARRAA